MNYITVNKRLLTNQRQTQFSLKNILQNKKWKWKTWQDQFYDYRLIFLKGAPGKQEYNPTLQDRIPFADHL